MIVISTREFRDNLAKYLNLATDEDVVVRRPDGNYILLEPKNRKEISKMSQEAARP